MAAPQTLPPPSESAQSRFLELGGQAVHVFRFRAPANIAYEYFTDVPAVFRLLPDALDVRAYGPDRHRLVIGASDGYGHTMAAVFDLRTVHDPCRTIRVVPADDGPPIKINGLVFSGSLAAEAIFKPDAHGTTVEYTVDIEMNIPIPGMLRLVPMNFLQNLGERGMEHKMTHMIDGFTRSITDDFHNWIGAN